VVEFEFGGGPAGQGIRLVRFDRHTTVRIAVTIAPGAIQIPEISGEAVEEGTSRS
jgi:hypothetical protein